MLGLAALDEAPSRTDTVRKRLRSVSDRTTRLLTATQLGPAPRSATHHDHERRLFYSPSAVRIDERPRHPRRRSRNPSVTKYSAPGPSFRSTIVPVYGGSRNSSAALHMPESNTSAESTDSISRDELFRKAAKTGARLHGSGVMSPAADRNTRVSAGLDHRGTRDAPGVSAADSENMFVADMRIGGVGGWVRCRRDVSAAGAFLEPPTRGRAAR